MKRSNIPAGGKWDGIIGYSRAVRIGNTLEISGTTATNAEGRVEGVNDIYRQTQFILEKFKGILEAAAFKLEHTVRTRMFITDISQWEKVGRAHGEFFGVIRPATTMVEVSKLIDPEHMIEIELTAVLSE